MTKKTRYRVEFAVRTLMMAAERWRDLLTWQGWLAFFGAIAFMAMMDVELPTIWKKPDGNPEA
jgi:uncharacterized membrane protein YhaH (DUF805 family)